MSFTEWVENKKQNSESVVRPSSFSEWVSRKNASSVNADYINTFISDYNNFLTYAEKDYENINFGNASSVSQKYISTANDLKRRASHIKDYLDINKNSLTEENYNEILSVANLGENVSKITDSFKKNEEFFSQFESEEKYKEYADNVANIDENYINTFFSDVSNFSKRANNYLKKVKTNPSPLLYNNFSAEGTELSERAEKIKTYLKYNKNKLDEETYTNLLNNLNSFQKEQEVIISATQNAPQYNAWATKDAVKLDELYSMSLEDIEKEMRGADADKQATIESLTKERDKLKNKIIYYNRGDKSKFSSADAKNKAQKKVNELNERINELKSSSSIAYTTRDGQNITWQGLYNEVSRKQEAVKLTNNAINASDFEEKSKYVSTKINTGKIGNNEIDAYEYGDTTYEYINGNNDNLVIMYLPKKDYNYNQMTEDEVKIYNYYYATKGKQQASKYLETIQKDLNYKAAKNQFNTSLKNNTGIELLFGAVAGIDQFSTGLKNLFNTKDDYITPSSLQMASEMVRDDLKDDGFKILGSSVGQIGYDLINTTSNMLPSVLTSAVVGMINPVAGQIVGAGLMGASASGNAYSEAINSGYSKGQARLYSGLVGVSEATLQYLIGGIGKLGGGKLTSDTIVRFANTLDKAAARVALKLGASAVSEFTEEYLQEVLDPFFKNIALGTNEEIKIFSEEALYSGILGALSAGLLETGGTIKSDIRTTKLGEDIKNIKGGVESIKRVGQTFSADSVAYKIAGKVDANTSAYKIGLLFNEVSATLSKENISAITTELTRKGMDKRSATRIAKSYQKFLDNEMRMTDEQVAVLEALDPLADVLRKSIIGQNTEIYNRTRDFNTFSNSNVTVDSIQKGAHNDIRVNKNGEAATDNMNSVADGIDGENVDNAVQNGYNNNRGDSNVYNQGGVRASTGESAQINTRGEKTDGRNWREDEETFTARNQGNTEETGRRGRVLLKLKNQSIAYTPSSNNDGHDGGKIAKLLKRCGIETVYVDGDIEIHEDGVTRLHSQGLTTPDGKVLISSNATATDIELAAHEAVHVNDIWQTEAYINYESVIRENVRWNSDKYSEIAEIINNGHYGGRYDIQDFSFSTKFIRELAAYVNQFVVSDIAWAETQFAELFDNWDAVVDASRQFNKDIGADFSESAFSMDENADLQSGAKGITEPDISKDTRSHEERVVEKMNGKESAREKDRRDVKRLGKLIGWEVRFDDIYARDKQGNIVYMTDKDGRKILDINGEPIPKRAESKVNKEKKIITFDYSNSKPIKTLLKHELTHFLETNAGVYRDFLNKVIESDAFKNWLQTSKKTDLKTYRDSVIEKYKGTNGFETAESSQISAEYEMVAEFVEENLFGDGTKLVDEIVKQMNTEQRSKFAQCIDKIFEKLKNFFSGKKQLSEIEALEQEWLKAYKAAEQTWQQQKNTTDENSGEQYAIRKGVAKKGKSVYNEYATNVMQWANSAGTNVGDVKIFNDRGKEFVLNEATEDGYIEIVRGNYEEVRAEYERAYNRANNEIYGNTKGIRANQGRDIWDMQSNSNRGNVNRNSGPSGSQGLQTDAAGDNEYLRTGDKGKHTNAINKTDTAELNNSAFSMPTNEKYSLASDNDTLLSMYENGEITREEYLRGIGKNEPKMVANYTETQYNNFGWVRYNEILDNRDIKYLTEEIQKINNGNRRGYVKTKYGDYIIPLGSKYNILVYTDNNVECPHIRKVLEINCEEQVLLDLIRGDIEDANNQKLPMADDYVKRIYGAKYFLEYKRQDFVSFRKYLEAERERVVSRTNSDASSARHNRRNGIQQNTGNDRAGLNNSAFSMPTDEKYSLATDNEVLLSMYENGEITREEFLKGFNTKSYGLKEITDLNAEGENTGDGSMS